MCSQIERKLKNKPFLCILGQYLQAEVDGGFGRDVMEFLIKRDVVAYRSMATKVTYIYPFTTALGDSKGQTERMNKIMEELGWYAPSLNLWISPCNLQQKILWSNYRYFFPFLVCL